MSVLFRYVEAVEHLGNIATVLLELAEKMEGHRPVEVAKREGSLAGRG